MNSSRGECHHHRAADAARIARQRQQRGDTAPGRGDQVIDLEALDQRQEDFHLVVLGDQPALRVVLTRLPGEGQVEQHHVEMFGQALAGPGERGGGQIGRAHV